jgi:hypothetical protein
MVREILNRHNELILKSIELLKELRELYRKIDNSSNKNRIQIVFSDIERCIEYANYYLSDENLYSATFFRFDSTLINFTDTIINDESIEDITKLKNRICEELINCAKDLIKANNELRDAESENC